MGVRLAIQGLLIGVGLTACSGSTPEVVPRASTTAKPATTLAPSTQTSSVAAKPPWSAPGSCAGNMPVPETLDVAFAALPARAAFAADKPPPVSKRGAKRKTKNVGSVDIMFVGRPHHGMYWGVGGVEPEEDAACFVAPAMEKLPVEARGRAAIFLERIADPKLAAPDATFLRAPAAGLDRDAALFLAAFFAKAPFAGPSAATADSKDAFGAESVLRDLMSRRGLSDPLGAKAALELAELLTTDDRDAVLGPLMKQPLSWASATSLRRLALLHWDGLGTAAGIGVAERLYMVVGHRAKSPLDRGEALVRAARIALELPGWSRVLGHANALVSDELALAALPEEALNDVARAVSYVLPGLSDAEILAILAWPPLLVGRVLDQGPSPVRARDKALYTHANKPFSKPEAQSAAALLEDLGRTCLVREDLSEAQSAVTVTVYESGPPTVTATGKGAFSSCLQALGPAYFEGATEGARAHVRAGATGLQ